MEPVTLIPFEPKLMDYSMMTPEQIAWLNEYNKKIVDTILPIFEANGNELAADWIRARTETIEVEKGDGSGADRARAVSTTLLTLSLTLSLL